MGTEPYGLGCFRAGRSALGESEIAWGASGFTGGSWRGFELLEEPSLRSIKCMTSHSRLIPSMGRLSYRSVLRSLVASGESGSTPTSHTDPFALNYYRGPSVASP